jgi:glycosyltransferase involved in cell wall biosynthesis
MNDRANKFKKLLKSLKNQTCKNFKLIIFVDSKTPNNILQELENLTKIYLNSEDFSISEENPIEKIKNTKFESEFIITSRIDNDDEYFEKFVETIQNSFREKVELIDTIGIQYDNLNNKKYTSGRTRPNSPFISLIERTNCEVKTVFYKQHTKMLNYFESRFVDIKEPLYKQNIHDNNITNKIIGFPID